MIEYHSRCTKNGTSILREQRRFKIKNPYPKGQGGNFAKGEYPIGLPTVSKLLSLCAEDANPLALRATGIKAPFPNKKATLAVAFLFGADDGNRTRVFGLGSERSTIELHLHYGNYYTAKALLCQWLF